MVTRLPAREESARCAPIACQDIGLPMRAIRTAQGFPDPMEGFPDERI